MSFPTKQSAPAAASTPTISSGTAAPNTAPAKVGDIYVDTNADKVYIATGTAADTDWTVLN